MTPGRRVAPRGMLRLMVDPVFGTMFWGKLLATMAQWIHNIVAAILAYQLSGGEAFAVGLVTAAQFLPQIVLAPYSGKIADRGNPAVQIVLGRLVTVLGSGGLAVWIWVVGDASDLPGGPAPVIAASFVVGIGFVIGGPALQSIVPLLVREDELAPAVLLNTIPVTVARAAGPALGAIVATTMGPATAFAIAGGVNLAFALLVIGLRLPRPVVPEGTDPSVRAVLRHLRRDLPLLALLLGTAATAVGAEPSITLTPTIANQLGGGEALIGWLASAFGIGCAVGVVVAGTLRRWTAETRLTIWGLVVLAAGLIILALVSAQWAALTLFGVCGLGMTIAFSCLTVLVQQHSPQELRGRIMALWLVAFLGARPIAAALDGLLTDLLAVEWALWASAAVVLGAAWLCRPSRLEQPAPQESGPRVPLRGRAGQAAPA